RYIAPDREVHGLASSLDATTGAYLAYASVFSAGGFGGTGVAVAVVDSGINPAQLDLTNVFTRQRRVVLGLDFTSQGKTDDSFGHGTHVAGIIAGNGGAGFLLG